MRIRANSNKNRELYWHAWARTTCYKTVFSLFGFMRWARSKIAREPSKKWHGPLWKQIGAVLFGTTVQLSIDKNGRFMYIRSYQINDLIALFGRPEERTVEEIIRSLKAGDVFFDVGAYIGQYTLLAADRVGKTGTVIAVEPENQNFELLQRNIRENNAENVSLFNFALGRQNGTAHLVSVTEDLAVSTLNSSWISALYPEINIDKQVTTVEVKTITTMMRELRINHIDLLKVDVEGAEVQVLEGGLEYFQSGKIRCVICELHGTRPEVKTLLERLSYQVEEKPQHIIAYLKRKGEVVR